MEFNFISKENKELADTVRYFKENEEGVKKMCKAMEELVMEKRLVTLFELVSEGLIKIADAAKKAFVSPEEFTKLMKEWENKNN